MLNLPRVTGWGTDTIASTMMKLNADERETEKERTRMIGNALLQQAKEGNLNDSGFSFLNEKFPELAGTAKQANETAKTENAAKLQNMKLQKTELGWKLFNQKIDAANKFGDETIYGDSGRELQKAAMAEAKQFADMMGIPFNMSAAMDAQDIKKEQKKFNMLLLQENIKGIQQGATPEQIASVEGMLAVFASKNKGEPAIPIMEKMIATAKSRLEKEAERKATQEDAGYKPKTRKESMADFEQKEQIKQKYAKPPTETGTLTEASVVTQFDNFALDKGTPELKGQMYNDYLQLRKKKMSREDAFNTVMQKYGLPAVPKPEPVKPNQKDFSSLWK